jgi:TRAP-type transport system small permease protein
MQTLTNQHPPVLQRIECVKKWVDRFCAWLNIGIVGLMTVLVVYQVVARYVFNSPSAVSEVLSRYLFIWLVLIGGAYVFGLREHMAITFLRDKFTPRIRIVLEMVCELFVMLFALAVMVRGGYFGMSRQMAQLDSALQIPVGYIYAAIPLSGLMIVLYWAYTEYKLIHQLRTHDY